PFVSYSFLFTAPAPPEIYPLSLHDALPISSLGARAVGGVFSGPKRLAVPVERRLEVPSPDGVRTVLFRRGIRLPARERRERRGGQPLRRVGRPARAAIQAVPRSEVRVCRQHGVQRPGGAEFPALARTRSAPSAGGRSRAGPPWPPRTARRPRRTTRS